MQSFVNREFKTYLFDYMVKAFSKQMTNKFQDGMNELAVSFVNKMLYSDQKTFEQIKYHNFFNFNISMSENPKSNNGTFLFDLDGHFSSRNRHHSGSVDYPKSKLSQSL